MDSFIQDLRVALRSFGRNKAVAVAAFLALSIGVGANTAVFSVVHAVLLAPLPYPDGDRLVTLRAVNTATGDRSPVAPPVYEAMRAQARSLSSIASSRDVAFTLGGEGEPEQVLGYRFDAAFWSVLGVHPQLGRTSTSGDERGPRTMVLSDNLFRRRYSADPAIVGHRAGRGRLLYGVAPADPLTYSLVCTGLLSVAVAASLLPARRAAAVDPMVALREE